MILVLSDRNDSHANFVLEKITKRDLPCYRLNLDVESLMDTEVCYKDQKWTIKQGLNPLIIEDVKCVWNRRTFVELLLEEEYDQSLDFKLWKGEWNKTLLGIYASISHIPWLNFWRLSYAAENKFFQMETAMKCGLMVPDTIVSNNVNDLKAFTDQHNPVALKLMQQDFYKGQNGEFKGFYVSKLNPDDLIKFGDRKENPIVLQKYIDKDYEVRYTVVGKMHFACKIQSQDSKIANIDWRRYDIPNTPHFAIEIPEKIKECVNLFMNKLNIEYGALDFIVTKDDKWFFLEVNSMGQFLWIEDLTGLPISEALIQWMENHLN